MLALKSGDDHRRELKTRLNPQMTPPALHCTANENLGGSFGRDVGW